MILTVDTMVGFSGSVLAPRYDNPLPIPDFHKELWQYCLSDAERVAIAAPRGHAKSTSITHAYTLACVLFRTASFVMIVSDTEGQAVQFLGDIKAELIDNDELREMFGVQKILKDTETEIIVRTADRHQFKIIAKGSGQKIRGTKWLGKRPDLIVMDDMENEELTANPERREKFRHWFYGALLPCGSDTCKFRLVGTVLHNDSLLERLLHDDTWVSKRYAAHNEDFSVILWEEKFSEKRLRDKRKGFINQGFPDGYYCEYLNIPIDPTNAYFRKADFIKMEGDVLSRPLNYYAAVDFAISSKERADRTAIVVGGVDSDNLLHILHVAVGRWDAKQIIDEMMAVQQRFNPEVFTAESGQISKSIGPFLEEEMLRTGVFLNINKEVPTKDKPTRARSIQGRMRAGGVRFDKDAPWYAELEEEMLTFPKAGHDDIVDAVAWLGLTLDKFAAAPNPEEQADIEWYDEIGDDEWCGQSYVTGY